MSILAPPPPQVDDVFVGRQPIFTSEFKTFAYELLFRSSKDNEARFTDGEQATAEVLLSTFAEIGLSQIVGKLPAFVNVSENFILEGYCYALPKEKVVIEILEDVRPTPEVVVAVQELREDGYTIALDDFVHSPELMPLVEVANIVKVDLPLVPQNDLARHVDLLRDYGVQLLAEKVETIDEFNRCKSLGFDYFQGYLFCRPRVIKGRRLSVSRVSTMRLVANLQNPTKSVDEIAEVIQTEPAFAFKLLRYVNSAFCGLTHKIDSIKHAVTLVGVRQMRTICSLSALVSATNEKPNEFVRTILIRAKMAELLAKKFGAPRLERFFMAGLFSAMDGMLDVPIEEALLLVPISNEIRDAIVDGSGELGAILSCVMAYEKGNWDEVACGTLDNPSIRNAYLGAVSWANDSLDGLASERQLPLGCTSGELSIVP